MPKTTESISLESTNLFLFAGPADSGKSYAAASWGLQSKKYGGTDDRPAYMLELDGRESALRNRPIVYDSFTNEDGAIGVLNKVKELRETCIKYKQAPFHTMIFDSFTTYNDFAIADSQEVTREKRGNKGEGGRVRGELLMLTTEDYGYEAESWRQLMYECFVDLKKYCNVIVTAHEVPTYKNVKGNAGEPTKVEYDGLKILAHGNKISARIPTKFDEIYHFLPKEKVISQHMLRRKICFQDELGRTSYPQLSKTTESYDITGKEFYPWWKEMISK